MTIWQDFHCNSDLPIHKWTHYFPLYESHLKRYQNRSCTILEIGCDKGGSLRLWKRLLGPYAIIVGLDIDPLCKEAEEEQIHITIGSQADPETLNQLIEQYAPFDVIIDDGSHVMSDIATSFRQLFNHVSIDGCYIVEDLHTAYWPEFGGGLGHPASFIEFTKQVIDAIHFAYLRETPNLDPLVLNVAKATRSVHIADSMVIFEKGRSIRKHAEQRGRLEPATNLLSELSFGG
jgi:cephalosporin hydroxylase